MMTFKYFLSPKIKNNNKKRRKSPLITRGVKINKIVGAKSKGDEKGVNSFWRKVMMMNLPLNG